LFEPSWLDAQGYTLLPWLTALEQSALDGCIAGDNKVSMVRPATFDVTAMMGSLSIH
jgi:hypothetical protein